jgi:hypothetical protein
MPKYRVIKITSNQLLKNTGYQVQYKILSLFGREFWANVGEPFPKEEFAINYVKHLQIPYSEEVVWKSD